MRLKLKQASLLRMNGAVTGVPLVIRLTVFNISVNFSLVFLLLDFIILFENIYLVELFYFLILHNLRIKCFLNAILLGNQIVYQKTLEALLGQF